MTSIRFLLDENTPHAIGDQLIRREPEIEILAVGMTPAPALAAPDAEILLWLEREKFCLVTRNRRSMPRHLRAHLAAGHHVPGIFTVRPHTPFRQVIEDLLVIWTVSNADTYQDQIVHIPI